MEKYEEYMAKAKMIELKLLRLLVKNEIAHITEKQVQNIDSEIENLECYLELLTDEN